MNIANLIDTRSSITNAGGQHYLVFPYTSSIGRAVEDLTVNVPIAQDVPSPSDKKALLEAVTIQGHMGSWVQKDDGAVWLMPAS